MESVYVSLVPNCHWLSGNFKVTRAVLGTSDHRQHHTSQLREGKLQTETEERLNDCCSFYVV